MNISEIKPGTDLVVRIMMDSAPVAINTRALVPFKSNGLLVDTLRVNGEPIPDWTEGSIDPFTDNKGERHQFKIDSILAVDKDGQVLHALKGSEIVFHDANRRKSERYVLNLLAKAELGRGKVFNVIIYDISMRGISLMLGKCPYKINKGDIINVTFRKDAGSKAYNVNCKVTRQFMVGTYPTVGCLLMGISPELLTFILKIRASKDNSAAVQAQKSASRVSVRTAPSNSGAAQDKSHAASGLTGAGNSPKKEEGSITPGSQFSVTGGPSVFKI